MKVSPFLSRLGITRVARQTGLDHLGIPVWCAFTPNSRGIVVSNGKGLDDEAARTSAVMEAIERSVASQTPKRVTFATAQALRAEGIAYDELSEFLAKGMPLPRLSDNTPWVEGVRLQTGASLLLPRDAVTMDRSRRRNTYWQTSDGLASGNTVEEAILHGLLERIERDALTLWELMERSERQATRINAESFSSLDIKNLLDRLEAENLQIALFDISSNIPVPCIFAVLAPRIPVGAMRFVEVTAGAGAGFDPVDAAIRAITEAAQSRMTFIAGARDDISPEVYRQPPDNISLAGFDCPPVRHARDLLNLPACTTQEALQHLLGIMASLGFERLYAVDLSPDWLPVKVVKVVAPELENPEGQRRQRFGLRALMRRLR